MNDLLAELLELTIGDDPAYRDAVRAAMKCAEPQYDRLCAAMEDKIADEIWDAALDIGSAGQEPIFLNGLRLGIRLMALCFL